MSTPSIPICDMRDIITSSRRVLLLLDIQKCMLFPPPIGVPSSNSVGQNIARVLEQARNAKPPPLIIHVRNCGGPGEADEPNKPGWQLIFSLEPKEQAIDKLKNNAFVGTDLGEIIPPEAEIVVVGFQTDFSIRATCLNALKRGNDVILIRGAHATHDRIEVLHGGGIRKAVRIEADVEEELEEAGVYLLEMSDLHEIFMNR